MELNYLQFFNQEKSNLDKIDPKIKILLITTLVVFILYTWNITTLILITLGLIIMSILFRVSLRDFRYVLEGTTMFLTIFLITLMFTYGEDMVYIFNIIPFSMKGLKLGLVIMSKAISILLSSYILLKTTYLPDLIKAIKRFKIPKSIAWILVLVFRYLISLSIIFWKIYSSAKLRGFESSLRIEGLKILGILITSFIIKSFDKCKNIEYAFKLRLVNELPDFKEYTFNYVSVDKSLFFMFIPLFTISVLDIVGCIPCLM